MPTKTIIESRLKEINGSDFQNLINAFLQFKGYILISAPGSTVAKNKTRKGAPDSKFYNENGKYVLCEMTTQDKEDNKKEFVKKLKKDIGHCFDESKTGIPKSDIGEIILATNSRIDDEEKELKEYISKKYDIKSLKIYSIQNLAEELVQFPDIDEFFPEITYYQGISTLNRFIDNSEKGYRPNLKNKYFKQENLFNNALKILKDYEILLINGNQGIGKTRLAIEVSKVYNIENNYQVFVIHQYYDNLKKDLLKIIQKNQKYIIIFDNYNQYDDIDSLINMIIEIHGKLNFKFIFTLRPIFNNDLKIELSNFNSKNELPLNKMSYDDMKKFVVSLSKEYGFYIKKNHLDNIIELSKGNIGFLLMILLPIIENNDYSYIDSLEKAYENYFNNYKSLDTILKDYSDLEILGILSFYNKINLDNTNLIHKISNVFDINLVENKNRILKLINYEILTKRDNIIEFSDTILSNYIFYYVFISKNILSFEDLVINFIESNSDLIQQKIDELIQVFGKEDFKNKKFKILITLESQLEGNNLISFYEIFNIYFEIQILYFVKKWLNNETEERFEKNRFKIPNMHNYLNINREIKLLSFLLHSSYDLLTLKLFIEIIYKKPSLTKEVFYHLKETYSYNIFSLQHEYLYQNTLMDFLKIKEDDQNKEKIKEIIFLFLLKENRLFDWYHVELQPIGNFHVNINRFKMPNSNNLLKFRLRLLNHLLKLYDKYQKYVEICLKNYIGLMTPEYSFFILHEEETFKKFFTKMDFNRYFPNKLAYDYFNKLFEIYLDKFGKCSNIFPDFFEFNHPQYIEKINSLSFIFNKSKKINHEEKINQIKNYLKNNQDYVECFELLNEIKEVNDYHYNVDCFFIALIKFDEALFIESFNFYISNNYSLLKSFEFIEILINESSISTIKIYELFNNSYYDELEHINHVFFSIIPKNQINEFIFYKLIKHIKNATWVILKPEDYIKYEYQFENLKNNLNTTSTNIIQYLTEILLKAKKLRSLFIPAFSNEYQEYFKDNVNLLKEIYYLKLKLNDYKDYNFEELETICKLDKFFLKEYYKWRIDNNDEYYKNEHSMKFVWNLDYDYEYISSVILFIINNSKGYHCGGVSLLFSGSHGKEVEFFETFIEKNFENKKAIEVIFINIKKYYSIELYIKFLKKFLILNKNIIIFKIIIEPDIQIRDLYVEEEKLKSDLQFYKKIKKMLENLNSLEYIEHLCIVETKINETEIA